MTYYSPLRSLQESAEASYQVYGPAQKGVEVVESFGNWETEYAAIRKGVGILEMPQRGIVEVSGSGRLEFLHRLLSHDTKTLNVGQGRRAFLLNKQGRICADMIVLATDQVALLDLDLLAVPAVVSELDRYIFSEDVQVSDRSKDLTHLALHGPDAASLLATVVDQEHAARLAQMDFGGHLTIHIACHEIRVFRDDQAGALGFHLLVPSAGAATVYRAMADCVGGLVPKVRGGPRPQIIGRGIGWQAYNVARIEAGTPLFHVDFGADNLPHETGILHQAVSFTKGCYVGQEIVARMESRGHPKRMLTGLRFENDTTPEPGASVLEKHGDSNNVIGKVTSSTRSPILGHVGIAFAMMNWRKCGEGTPVTVNGGGHLCEATVHPLRFFGM